MSIATPPTKEDELKTVKGQLFNLIAKRKNDQLILQAQITSKTYKARDLSAPLLEAASVMKALSFQTKEERNLKKRIKTLIKEIVRLKHDELVK